MTHFEELQQAKAEHKKALQNKHLYLSNRDDLVRHMLQCQTPNWGILKVSLVNW